MLQDNQTGHQGDITIASKPGGRETRYESVERIQVGEKSRNLGGRVNRSPRVIIWAEEGGGESDQGNT